MPNRLKFLLAALLVLLGVAVWRWTTQPRPGPGGTEYAAAQAALQKGDLPAAEAALRRAVLAEPGNGDYHAELGDVLLQQARYDRAAAELEAAAFLAPNRPHLFCQLAQVLVEQRRRDEALSALETALKKTPDCPHGLAVRGELYLRDDNMKAALEDFRRVLQVQPDFALGYQKAGYILVKTNQYREAEEVLRRGLTVAPASPGIHLLLGEVLLKKAAGPADLKLAEQHFQSAIPNNPEASTVQASLGRVHLRQGDLDAAREEFQKALGIERYQADALYGLAQVARRQGKQAESRLYLDRYEKVQAFQRQLSDMRAQAIAQPDNVDLRLKMARICLEGGLLKEAGRVLNQSVEADPARREARELRAQLYRALGEDAAAAREFQVAERLPRVVLQ